MELERNIPFDTPDQRTSQRTSC